MAVENPTLDLGLSGRGYEFEAFVQEILAAEPAEDTGA